MYVLKLLAVELLHLGSQQDDSVSPEEASFVEEEVEAELRGQGDQTEDEGEQEENTWTDFKHLIIKSSLII